MRPVHVLHDAAVLARLLGVETPCCAQLAMSTAGQPVAWGAFVEGNPLSGGWIVDVESPSRRTVSWSGTLAAELFGDEPRTWMRSGQDCFRDFLDEVSPALHRHQRTVCFRPHHRHVLGDVHSAVKLLRDRAGEPFEVLLSPSDLLAPSMLPRLEEHLARMFTHLGPVAAAIMISDVALPDDSAEETGLLAPCPLGQGVLGTPLLARLLHECVPVTTPVILLPQGLDAQRAVLAL